MDNFTQDLDEKEQLKPSESKNIPKITSNFTSDLTIDTEYIKTYLKSHPEAWKDILSPYKSDIDSLLESAGLARPIVENALKSKVPWLWDAIYPNSNGNTNESPKNISQSQSQAGYDSNPDNNDTNEDLDENNDVNPDDWKAAMEYAIDLRKDRFPPGKISDKLLEHYGIDIHPTQIGRLVNEYILDRKADAYIPDVPNPKDSRLSGRGQGSSRTQDSILMKVSALLADKKSLEEKLKAFETRPQEHIGLLRTLWKKLY